MNYYIFRHGETFATKFHIPYGSKIHTAEILPEGIPAIERLADYLKDIKSDVNFTSPFLRCKQTVEIVEKITKKSFTEDVRLGEYIEGYLAFRKFKTRIVDFLNDMESKKYQNILVCTHGAGISAIKHLVVKNSYHIWNLPDYPKPGILTIINDGKTTEVNFN
ncbi:hypothetical protein A2115_03705 [Candidatus Woesebacteria bacterium GWA1_41_8]|jgi:broad specificity phosphatase PhoE|uniref:Phosphoglycerate mutase n=1 Tax=Candidatus Woesebacteria bacterium GWA1_41_8 TaxID=1802471 RepID=A0A1F7WH98_9BACT|nr:MAG: hypothetical protein A2115_03705 [Candidatus Woesebacteria bacterium GWA1_41_8]